MTLEEVILSKIIIPHPDYLELPKIIGIDLNVFYKSKDPCQEDIRYSFHYTLDEFVDLMKRKES
ncbi:MAG: hypothetical protein ACFE9S_07580 [Candidatus Hermodarchaeota archaeon]